MNSDKKIYIAGHSGMVGSAIIRALKSRGVTNIITRQHSELDLTNQAAVKQYAIAKIAGIKLCESYNRQFGSSHNIDYRSIMPTNLYGFGDNYDLNNSHVIPALIKKFHLAKINNLPKVEIWGTGSARREFLFVDDLAEAALFIMNLSQKKYSEMTTPMNSQVNVGYGSDISIKELVELIAEIIGFEGNIVFDVSKPDGAFRKLTNCSKLKNLGWQPKINLSSGLRKTYKDFLMHHNFKI